MQSRKESAARDRGFRYPVNLGGTRCWAYVTEDLRKIPFVDSETSRQSHVMSFPFPGRQMGLTDTVTIVCYI